ncbi:DUF1877 family protein [Streptomyces sp. NPDC052496]|uniref:DUF1877 family protein n=1 Tax=Streptomyces sp. NPDC052496 TaxID=3154951 RepID=UPI00341AC49C
MAAFGADAVRGWNAGGRWPATTGRQPPVAGRKPPTGRRGPKLPEQSFDRPGEPDGGSTGELDKAWAGLQFLLDAEGVSIELMMDGFPIGEDGLSGWSVEEVREAAERLGVVPFERLAAH